MKVVKTGNCDLLFGLVIQKVLRKTIKKLHLDKSRLIFFDCKTKIDRSESLILIGLASNSLKYYIGSLIERKGYEGDSLPINQFKKCRQGTWHSI